MKESNDRKWREKLKTRIEIEAEAFFLLHKISDKVKFKQLLRNLRELIEQEEV